MLVCALWKSPIIIWGERGGKKWVGIGIVFILFYKCLLQSCGKLPTHRLSVLYASSHVMRGFTSNFLFIVVKATFNEIKNQNFQARIRWVEVVSSECLCIYPSTLSFLCQHRPIPKWRLPKLQLHTSQIVAFEWLIFISVCSGWF